MGIFTAVPEGVADQVVENLLKLTGVKTYLQAGRNADTDLLIGFAALKPLFADTLDEFSQDNTFRRTILSAGQIQDIVDDAAHAGHIGRDDIKQAPITIIELCLCQQTGGMADGRERIADFMGDGR